MRWVRSFETQWLIYLIWKMDINQHNNNNLPYNPNPHSTLSPRSLITHPSRPESTREAPLSLSASRHTIPYHTIIYPRTPQYPCPGASRSKTQSTHTLSLSPSLTRHPHHLQRDPTCNALTLRPSIPAWTFSSFLSGNPRHRPSLRSIDVRCVGTGTLRRAIPANGSDRRGGRYRLGMLGLFSFKGWEGRFLLCV